MKREIAVPQSGWAELWQPWKKLNDSGGLAFLPSDTVFPCFGREFIPIESAVAKRRLTPETGNVLQSVYGFRGSVQEVDKKWTRTEEISGGLKCKPGRQINNSIRAGRKAWDPALKGRTRTG